MSLQDTINGLITDLIHLKRIYLQLYEVPKEVQDLVHLLGGVRSRLTVAARLLATVGLDDSASYQHLSTQPFSIFRKRLLDLELFLDPEQHLHYSGRGAENQHSVPWNACDHGDYRSFCMSYREHILSAGDAARALIDLLNESSPVIAANHACQNNASPSLASLRSFALQGTRSSSPASIRAHHRRGKRSPKTKTEEEMIFDRFVQQYSTVEPHGKRKRPGDGNEASLVSLDALSRQLPFPFPAGQDELESMQRMIRGTGNSADADVPDWNLDDLLAALPESRSSSPSSLATTASRATVRQAKGKQRASLAPSTSTIHLSEFDVSETNSSSSGSIRSFFTRPRSTFSMSSRNCSSETTTATSELGLHIASQKWTKAGQPGPSNALKYGATPVAIQHADQQLNTTIPPQSQGMLPNVPFAGTYYSNSGLGFGSFTDSVLRQNYENAKEEKARRKAQVAAERTSGENRQSNRASRTSNKSALQRIGNILPARGRDVTTSETPIDGLAE